MDRAEAVAFWNKYYVASNITIAVVGDVNVKEVKKLAEKYFADVPTGPEPARVGTPEPKQAGERRVTLEDPAQPFVFIGYHIPDAMDPDYGAYELLSRGLGQGRSSRLYTELVKRQKIAADVGAFSGFPGEKYPTLLMIYAMVSAGEDPYEVEEAIYEVIDDLLENPISEDELEGLKTRSMAEIIRRVRSNGGLAWALTTFERLYGDWHRLFHLDEEMALIDTDDLQRIASETFVKKNRNVAMIVNPE
jgi:predicted Zn-dependent peptidase